MKFNKKITDYSYQERTTESYRGDKLKNTELIVGSDAWKDYENGVLVFKKWNPRKRIFEYKT